MKQLSAEKSSGGIVKSGMMLGLVALAIGVLSGCSDQKPILKPYRGAWVADLPILPALAAHFKANSRTGFDSENVCVQLVNRDKTPAGVRQDTLYAVFSNSKCPGKQTVAEPEAFALEVEEVRIAKAPPTGVPARAYVIVLENTPAGDISVTENDPDDEEDVSYELTSLCALEEDMHIRDNCRVHMTNEGRFSRISTNRAGISRHVREQNFTRYVEDSFTQMDQLVRAVRKDLAQGQQDILDDMGSTLQYLRSEILAGRSVVALLVIDEIRFQSADLASRNRTEFSSMNTAFQARMQQMEDRLLKELKAEIQGECAKLRKRLDEVRTDVLGEMGKVRDRIIGRIDAVEKQLNKRIDEGNKKLTEKLDKTIELLGKIKSDLITMEKNLKTHMTNEANREVKEVKAYIDSLQTKIEKYIREQLAKQKTDIDKMIKDAEGRLKGNLDGLDKKLVALKKQIDDQTTALKTHMEKSDKEQADRVLKEIDTKLKKLLTDIGKEFTASEKRQLTEYENLIKKYDDLLFRRIRDDLTPKIDKATTAVNTLKIELLAKIKEVKDDTTKIKTDLTKTLKLAEDMKKLLDDVKKHMIEDEKQWKLVTKTLGEMDTKLKELKDAMAKAKISDDAILKELTALKKSIQDATGQILRDLKAEIASTRTELAALRTSVVVPAVTSMGKLLDDLQTKLGTTEAGAIGTQARLLEIQLGSILSQSATLKISPTDQQHLKKLLDTIQLHETIGQRSVLRNLQFHSLAVVGHANGEADFAALKNLINANRPTHFADAKGRADIQALITKLKALPANKVSDDLKADMTTLSDYLKMADKFLYDVTWQYLTQLVEMRRNFTGGFVLVVPGPTGLGVLTDLAMQDSAISGVNNLIAEIGLRLANGQRPQAIQKAGDLKKFLEHKDFKAFYEGWKKRVPADQATKMDTAMGHVIRLTAQLK